MAKSVDLGFAEECESLLLTNRFFPSKIGGKPAWLELQKLPTPAELKCSKCEQQKSFLCQIYAPIEDQDECFHRTIFIFVCRTKSCWLLNTSANITVLRSQLGRENLHYPYNPPDEKNKQLGEILPTVKLCSACGCSGPLICSRCKKITYCGSAHQKLDWKNHKLFCKENSDEIIRISLLASEIAFPEFEIDIGPDNSSTDEVQEKLNESQLEQKRLEEYRKMVEDGKDGVLKDISEAELNQYSGTETVDKQFDNFKKSIQEFPEQVLRYSRNGTPLWITNIESDTISNIPDCENCGSTRSFEFQIMPQLLNYLKDDHVDWGVLAIFTCTKSCSINCYVQEIAIKQDFVKNE